MGGTGPVACHATDHQGEPPSPKYGDLRRSVTGPDVRWHRACGGYLIGPAARPFWHPSGEAAGTAGRVGPGPLRKWVPVHGAARRTRVRMVRRGRRARAAPDVTQTSLTARMARPGRDRGVPPGRPGESREMPADQDQVSEVWRWWVPQEVIRHPGGPARRLPREARIDGDEHVMKRLATPLCGWFFRYHLVAVAHAADLRTLRCARGPAPAGLRPCAFHNSSAIHHLRCGFAVRCCA